MSTQKQAVCNVILSVLNKDDREAVNALEASVCDVITDEQKAKARAIVLEGLMSGKIPMTEASRQKYDTEAKMKVYTSGVVNNYIKKNPEFNEGVKYMPENPGANTGRGDEKVKAMRALLKTPGLPPEAVAEINEAINKRLAEIKPSQVVEIKVEHLPEHLRHLATPKS